MADNNNPLDPTTTSTLDAANLNNNLKESVDGLSAAFGRASASMKSQAGSLKEVKSVIVGMIPDSVNLKKAFDNITKSSSAEVSGIKDMFSGIGTQILSTLESVAGFGGALTALGGTATRDFFNPLKQSGLDAVVSVLPTDVKEMILGARDAAQSLLDVQNTSRAGFTRWQNSFLESGTAIYKANEAASAYPDTLRRIAASSVVSGEKLDNMMKSLQGMPIILDQNQAILNDVIGAQEKMVGTLGDLINVSKAFGMTEEDATQRAKSGYMDFNQSVTETISSLATMEAASKATGIDRKIADDQIVSASKNLAIFGQKSDAAAGLWTTFTSSLKDTIPLRQIGDIVTDVTNKIAGMSVQNRAFISMMSGMSQGRSAMGGALQLEIAMRTPEGMEKNLQAMTSTLSQFAGGKIITLEEAANNPQLEIQFQLQRDMLGKISNISDPQAQNRVLEVLQKVQSGGMSQVEGGKELTSLMGKGSNIQERQLNALDTLVNIARANAGAVLKPENQLEEIGNALLGRTKELSSPEKGTARVRRTMREVPKENKLLRDPSYQIASGKMFQEVGKDLANVIRVDLVGAIKDLKKIFDIGTVGSGNKNLTNQIPLIPSLEPKTISSKEIIEKSKETTIKELPASISAKEPLSIISSTNLNKELPMPPLIKPELMPTTNEGNIKPFVSPPLQVPNVIEPSPSIRQRVKNNEAEGFATLTEESINKNKSRSVNVETKDIESKLYVEIAINSDAPGLKNYVKGEIKKAIEGINKASLGDSSNFA